MKSILFSAAIATVGLLGTSVASVADVYECQLPTAQKNGWVPEVVVFTHTAGEKTAIVYDPIIDYFVGKAIEGKVVTENAKRLTVKWILDGVTNSANQHAKFEYRLTYVRASGKLNMTANALNYVGPFTGRGKCTVKPS